MVRSPPLLLVSTLLLLLSVSPSSVESVRSPHDLVNQLREKHGDDFVVPKVNHGFEGVITKEDWDESTVKDAEPVTIQTETLSSNITGFTMETYYGRRVYAYQGLPFALKATRFMPPEPLTGPLWGLGSTGMYQATHLPEKCSQHALMFPNIPAGSEDCLFLNVYTPQLPVGGGSSYSNLMPVMIFYHGGAFLWGDSSLYMPTRLLERDVLLVVPHYRLGSFGFFTTMDDRAPGNIALYDQQMAMKWVQEHISDFGGDPNHVTIFGQSAGGASVNYHLISPSSAGLFTNVIGESGSALEFWALDPDPLESSMAIGELLECDTTSIDTVYTCMMAADEGDITWAINELSKEDRKTGGMGFRGAAPIVQGVDVTNPMVSKLPISYYEDGDFNKDVNLMIGANKHEGSFVLGVMYSSYMLPNGYVDDPIYIQETMVSDMIKSFGIVDVTHAIEESFWEEYLAYANRNDFTNCTDGMIDMSGVLFEKAGAWETAKLHSYYKDASAKTFFYSFDFESDDTMFYWLFLGHHPDEFPFEGGVTHSDELLYIFSWPAVMDGRQILIKDRMVELWTNFATYNDPTPDTSTGWGGLDIPKWQEVSIASEMYMLMEDDYRMATRYPDRWTIKVQDTMNQTVEPGLPTTKTTTLPTTTSRDPTNPELVYTEEEYDEIKDERDAYLATMIVFIVLFIVAGVGGVFLFMKWRKAA